MAVYFLREDGPDGRVKIGTTTGNPYARMATLQTGNSRELRLLVSIPGGADEESSLHERFAALRERGEWFRPDPTLLSFIDGLAWAYREQQPEPTPPNDPTAHFGITWDNLLAVRGALKKLDGLDALDAANEEFEIGNGQESFANDHTKCAELHRALMRCEYAVPMHAETVELEGADVAEFMWLTTRRESSTGSDAKELLDDVHAKLQPWVERQQASWRTAPEPG